MFAIMSGRDRDGRDGRRGREEYGSTRSPDVKRERKGDRKERRDISRERESKRRFASNGCTLQLIIYCQYEQTRCLRLGMDSTINFVCATKKEL